MSIFRYLVVLAAFIAAPDYASAAGPRFVNLGDRVRPESAVTYLDLARQIVPDLHSDGTGMDNSKLDDIRHIGGPDTAATISTIRLSLIQRLDLPETQAEQALILFDFGPAEDAPQSVTILGLYDLSGTTHLLDMIDVGTDLQTSFAAPYLVSLSSKVVVASTHSWHLNSGEEFADVSLTGIWDGRLHGLDTISVRNWEWCHTFERHSLTLTKGEGVWLDAFMDVSHKEEGSCGENDSGGHVEHKRYHVRYNWDSRSQMLVPSSNVFKALQKAEAETEE